MANGDDFRGGGSPWGSPPRGGGGNGSGRGQKPPNIDEVIKKIEAGAKIKVPQRIRFRKEQGFWLMNIRWANTIEIPNDEAEFFLKKQKNNELFTYKDFKFNDPIKKLSNYICKDALISEEIKIEVRKTGVNIDPSKLPNLDDKDKILASHPEMEI